MLCLPRLMLPVPLSPWQATADPPLHRRHSNTHRQIRLSLQWELLLLSLGPGAHKLFCFVFAFQKSLVGMGFDFNMIAPLLQLLLWTWDIFFLVGSSILLLMVVQQLVAILVSLQKKMSSCPSNLPVQPCLTHSISTQKIMQFVNKERFISFPTWMTFTSLS